MTAKRRRERNGAELDGTGRRVGKNPIFDSASSTVLTDFFLPVSSRDGSIDVLAGVGRRLAIAKMLKRSREGRWAEIARRRGKEGVVAQLWWGPRVTQVSGT
jgi:hypothetical protein